MIGVAVFTHRALGQELLVAAESIVGPQASTAVACITGKDSLASIKEKCRNALAGLAPCREIIMLVDVLGGSASNAGLGLVNEFEVEIVAGVNLPMLISAFANRGRMGLRELANKVLEDGRKSVVNAKELYLKNIKK